MLVFSLVVRGPAQAEHPNEKWLKHLIIGYNMSAEIPEKDLPLNLRPNPAQRLHRQTRIRQLLARHSFAGVLLYTGDYERYYVTPECVKKTVGALRKAARSPLVICADYEGGGAFGSDFVGPGWRVLPTNMALAATGDIENARLVGVLSGQQLRQVDLDCNLSPVLDVNRAPDSDILSVRSFSDDPEIVAKFAEAYLAGCEQAGVLTVGKHFPGHGYTADDSHKISPLSPEKKDRILADVDTVYRRAVKSGLDAIMPCHVRFKNVDPKNPATLSRTVIQNLIRQRLGFTGPVISDALEMAAITQDHAIGVAARRTLEAGQDLLIVRSEDFQEELIQALLDAGPDIPEADRKASLKRIQAFLKSVGAPDSSTPEQNDMERLAAIHDKSVTLLATGEQLPRIDKNTQVLVLSPTYDEERNGHVAEGSIKRRAICRVWGLPPEAVITQCISRDTVRAVKTAADHTPERIKQDILQTRSKLKKLGPNSLLLIGIVNDYQAEIVKGLHAEIKNIPTVTLLLRNPSVYSSLQSYLPTRSMLCIGVYGDHASAIESGLRAFYKYQGGAAPAVCFPGRLPISVDGLESEPLASPTPTATPLAAVPPATQTPAQRNAQSETPSSSPAQETVLFLPAGVPVRTTNGQNFKIPPEGLKVQVLRNIEPDHLALVKVTQGVHKDLTLTVREADLNLPDPSPEPPGYLERLTRFFTSLTGLFTAVAGTITAFLVVWRYIFPKSAKGSREDNVSPKSSRKKRP